MHELSIAGNIVDIVERSVASAPPAPVLRVTVRVGRLSGIVRESLEFCFEAVTAGTRLEGARLVTEDVPVRLRCGACGHLSMTDDISFACAACGSSDVTLESGTELQVVEVELADTPAGESP